MTLDLAPPIATGATSDIHDWRDGQVLKLFRDGVPRAAGLREVRVTKALHAAGARVPAVGELVEVNGRLGLPMEKLSGRPLASRLIDSVGGTEAGLIAAHVHAAMHALTEPTLTPMRAQIRKIIEAGPLATDLKVRVLHTMESLPDGDRICHGDFHSANIMMTHAGPVVIDCVLAHQGNPRADVAQTCVAMTEWLHSDLPTRSKEAVASFIDAYERRYFELTSGHRDQIAAWKPIVAAVRFSFPHQSWSDAPLLSLIGAVQD